MKYIPLSLLVFTLSTSCQKPAATAIEKPSAEQKTKAIVKAAPDERAKPAEGISPKPGYVKTDEKNATFKEASPDNAELVTNNKVATNQALLKENTATDYKSLYESGYQKHNSGDFKGAIADFDKCISLNPSYSDAWNFRGMSKYKSGDKPGACSDWKKATELGNSQAQRTIDQYCK